VAAATSVFAKDLALALGLLGLVLAMATSVQIGLGLRPLDALRRGVADIRTGRSRHLPKDVPAEVRPLVEEVNGLLDAQEREIERSRSRAADLAHGLKTPLAALATDAARLRERGETAIAKEIETVGEAMRRHVDRELTLARVRGTSRQRAGRSTAIKPLVDSLVTTLARTPDGQRLNFEVEVDDSVKVALDRTDLAEVLGNLLENAARYAATRVRISSDGSLILVEDDGEGIAPDQMARVMERGGRLDERGDGAGIGLAIVRDVLTAYGWRLELAISELGGLRAIAAPAGIAAADAAQAVAAIA